MPSGENDSELNLTPMGAREYTARSAARHRSSGTTRRLLYFGLASVFGFIVGVGGLLVAMSAAGQVVHPGSGVIPGLIAAFVVAAAGGCVIAAAYKESKRRSR